jgi:hypothetical protein
MSPHVYMGAQTNGTQTQERKRNQHSIGTHVKCRYAYHFTSPYAWKAIQAVKYLLPQTEPFEVRSLFPYVSAKARQVCSKEKYIVCIPIDSLKQWAASGLLEELRQTKCRTIMLKIPVTVQTRGFIREHAFCSPQAIDKISKSTLSRIRGKRRLTKRDVDIMNECLIGYYNSSMKFEGYDGEYTVPEIWISEKVSINQITPMRIIEKDQP